MSFGVSRRHIGAQLAVAVVTFLLVLLVWTLTHSSGGVAAALDRGKTPVAPSFALKSLSGPGSIKLDTYGGRVIVVNFWASWCGPCRAETPALNRAWQRRKSHLVTFIGVDTRDAKADGRSFAHGAHISYPVGNDGSGRAARTYGVGALPTTFVISPRGRVVARLPGAVSAQNLSAAIARTLHRAGAE
jgi:cytochrome c biogenesis protein CcmG, thiol:disulfide interchange protein DsbE